MRARMRCDRAPLVGWQSNVLKFRPLGPREGGEAVTKERGSNVLKGLLIRQPWVDMILSGKKTWELRGSNTATRGRITIIESGSGTVVGTSELVDVVGPLSMDDLRRNIGKHCVPRSQLGSDLPYRRTHAWVLGRARRLPQPVPYDHPRGAVIWVNLPASVASKVRRAGGL